MHLKYLFIVLISVVYESCVKIQYEINQAKEIRSNKIFCSSTAIHIEFIKTWTDQTRPKKITEGGVCTL